MSPALVYSRARVGLDSPEVSVEVHLSGGLPAFQIVGLPEATVRESKDRVRGALENSQFAWPLGRITVNLAPADLPKEGGRFDLAIALAVLAASGQLPAAGLDCYEFLGELALTGALRPTGRTFASAVACREAGRALLLPAGDAAEAALVGRLCIVPATSLLEVCAHLRGSLVIERQAQPPRPRGQHCRDLIDVKGQGAAKRVLEIAAAGGHNVLFCGPPGTGKTMLATRLPGILPPLAETEWLEVAGLRSLAGAAAEHIASRERAFRAPHHSASSPALVGGGSIPRPGEASLAHRGILFLDELPEFPRRTLEVLREPMESGEVVIARAACSLRFPARFQLVAAMNPCPCGYFGDRERDCRCSPDQVRRYRDRISGPLLDRIDLQLFLSRPASEQLYAPQSESECSRLIRQRVLRCHQRQLRRQGKANAELRHADDSATLEPTSAARTMLLRAVDRFALSARACDRILRVARTIADLAEVEVVGSEHLGEALAYRMDRRAGPGA